MKMTKQNILAAATVLGLAAAVATPAMAFENEFHGAFTAQFINSNFNRTATTDYGPNDFSYDPSLSDKSKSSSNFVEQRARLKYIAKASNDLKLVTQFEIDYSYWGDNSYSVGRNAGGAIGADQINLETKNIYLDFNPTKGYNVKLGMMPNNDAFKGVLFDADMAGLLVSSSNFGKLSPSFGVFRFVDNGDDVYDRLGKSTSDMLMLDVKYAVTDNLKVGGAYYYFRDNTQGSSPSITGYDASGNPIYNVDPTDPDNTTGPADINMHVLGLNGEYSSGNLTLSGFAVYETGSVGNDNVNSFAANVGAAYKVGPGTARAEALYVMGSDDDKNSFYSVNYENGYYNNEMVILGRDKNAMTTDNAIIAFSGNKGQGQMGLYLGYDLPVTEKLATAFNVGFASIAKKNNTSTLDQNNGKYLGTEINAEATYTVLKGLTAGVRAGYAMLGSYYDNVTLDGKDPVNPYDLKLMVKYSF